MPIPKKPNPTLDDLRPISLLPVFSKILEKISLDSVKNDLLSMYGSNQFGFRPGCSTVHAHIVFHDYVTRILDSQHYEAAVVISFDMKKAFDSLHHNCLIQSLATGNFPYKALRWFASFLQDRQQSVCIQGISSSSTRVPSGVPQGSVLSPFLFAAHMGSLVPHDPKTLMLKYADDIVTITPIEGSSEAAIIIKSEIACVNSWCHSHGLQLNMQKTKIMIPAKKNIRIPVLHDFEVSSDIKMLGLVFNDRLSWDDQIHNVCKKASQRVFVLKKLKNLLTPSDLIKVYNVLILSILEYNCQVMVGMPKKNIKCMEKLRKRCHRIICGSDCRCSAFTCIRDRIDQHALKLFTNITTDTCNLLHTLTPQRLPRSHKFSIEFSRTQKRQQAFLPYCSILANRLGL